MTPEQLEILIFKTVDGNMLAEAFSQLTEKQRKSLSTHTNKLRSQLTSGKVKEDASDTVRKYVNKYKNNYWNSKAYNNIQLAVFALCPLTTVKRAIDFISWHDDSAVNRIIMDRKPDWIDDWLAFELEQEFSNIPFKLIRKWMKKKVCKKPSVDGYTRKFAWALMAVNHRQDEEPNIPISVQLLEEPDMQDDIWRLFEVENQAFNTESWLTNNAPDNYETWSDALVKLADKGVVERSALLDISLQGLNNDLKQNQLAGFHKFHERLSPSKKELVQRRKEYMALLFHKVGHVLKFSLKMLSRLEREKSLDLNNFLNDVTAVFSHEPKGNAVTALKLIGRITKKGGVPIPEALKAVAEGLRHPNVDVQALAIELLQKHETQITETLKSELQMFVDFVASANKPSLIAIIGSDEQATSENEDYSGIDLELIERQINRLTNIQKESLGLQTVKFAEKPELKLHPIKHLSYFLKSFEIMETIEPISDVDSLIQELSHAVEVVDNTDNVERILDGISRLCSEYPSDFDKKTAPLLKRITDGGGFESMRGLLGGAGGLLLAISDLVLTWLTGELYQSEDSSYFSKTLPLDPVIIKVTNIKHRVMERQAQPLLSFPTHVRGWIDPVIWIERLKEGEKNNSNFDRMDFCLSLLRLAPYNREQSLSSATGLSNNLERVVRFALGGDLNPEYNNRKDYDLWISAARARNPMKDWSNCFAPLKLSDNLPNSIRPTKYEWKAYLKEKNTYKYPKLKIKSSIAKEADSTKENNNNDVSFFSKIGRQLAGNLTVDWQKVPSSAFNQSKSHKYMWSCDLASLWVTQWLATLWPANPDAFYSLGVAQQVGRIDMDSSTFEPNFGFLSGLFEPNRIWSEVAHLSLCLGLVGKDTDSKALAVDALIEGIDNSLASHQLMADILIKLTNSGWLKFNRLADSLKQVAQVSEVHSYFLSQSLQLWLPKVDLKLRNIHRVLEVVLDVQTAVNTKISDDAKENLSRLTGKSKAAQIAKRILEIGDDTNADLDKIKLQIISSRLELAGLDEVES